MPGVGSLPGKRKSSVAVMTTTTGMIVISFGQRLTPQEFNMVRVHVRLSGLLPALKGNSGQAGATTMRRFRWSSFRLLVSIDNRACAQ
jgi:hypothetical protein